MYVEYVKHLCCTSMGTKKQGTVVGRVMNVRKRVSEIEKVCVCKRKTNVLAAL